jgi:purine-nucleoside phosphorylase
MAASTHSGVNRRATGGLDFAPIANYDLLKAAVDAAAAHGVTYHVGGIASMDLFYDDSNALDILEAHGVLGVEMEASGLYTIAARYGRRALAICTVSDMIRTHEKTSSEERETGFKAMVEVALEAAFA